MPKEIKENLIEKKIHKIIQDEIAGEVWYEDTGCEQKLERCLTKAKEKILELFSQEKQKWVEEIGKDLENLKNKCGNYTWINDLIEKYKTIKKVGGK